VIDYSIARVPGHQGVPDRLLIVLQPAGLVLAGSGSSKVIDLTLRQPAYSVSDMVERLAKAVTSRGLSPLQSLQDEITASMSLGDQVAHCAMDASAILLPGQDRGST
jgi:hypothetical protein